MDKSMHYMFYLDNAQKAIDIMITKHKQNKQPFIKNDSQSSEHGVKHTTALEKKLEQLKPLKGSPGVDRRRISVPLPQEAN